MKKEGQIYYKFEIQKHNGTDLKLKMCWEQSEMLSYNKYESIAYEFLCFINSYGFEWWYILLSTPEVSAGFCSQFWAKCIETHREVGESSEDNKNYCPHFLYIRERLKKCQFI